MRARTEQVTVGVDDEGRAFDAVVLIIKTSPAAGTHVEMLSKAFSINFQPENSAVTLPSGWLKDTGATYADRGNPQREQSFV